MATASFTTGSETITHKTIHLELTEEEAQALACVLGKVGGKPEGRRGTTEGVLRALERTGVKWFGTPTLKDLKGSLTFGEV
jgi:hypothetical protein